MLAVAAGALALLGPRIPAAAQSPSTTRYVTEADNGREIHVRAGDLVHVTLVPPAGARWTPPAGQDDFFFRQWLSLDDRATTAVYRSFWETEVVLRSGLDYECAHRADPCVAPARSFSVRVVVDPRPEPSASASPAPSSPSASPSCREQPPSMTTGPVDNAVEVTEEDAGTKVPLVVGQRLSIRVRTVAYDVGAPASGMFVDRWYVDDDNGSCSSSSPRSHVVVHSVGPSTGEVVVTDSGVCDYFLCGRPSYEWRYPVEVTAPPSNAAAAEVVTTSPRITAGNSPRVDAHLTTASGSPAHGYVTLYSRAWGEEAYRMVGTKYADGRRSVSFLVRPLTQTAYVAVVQTPGGRVASPSRVVFVHARVLVEHPAANGGLDGKAAPFTGSLLPAIPNVPVGVSLVTADGLRYLAQGRTGADGRFGIRAGGIPAGWQTFVVYTSARAGTLRGSTRVRAQVA
ncbi:MAG TPA: hypothetical protein VNA12_07865 [Mycobacteriales bacterium]|nr:hypothetical protein [Mycobacteriales bacterium]